MGASTREILLKLLGRETVSDATKRAARGLKDMGDAADDAGRRTADLDARIRDAIKTTAALRGEIARTGDVTLFRDLGRAERELGKLSGLRKAIGDAGDSGAIGFAARFSARIGPLLAQAPVSPPLVGAIAAASPAIGAAMGAAVLGGLSAGAVAAGVAAAFRDNRVISEARDFRNHLQGVLRTSTAAFVPATIAGMRVIGNAVADLRPQFQALGDDAAAFVLPLARGVANLVKGAIPGIAAGLKEAGPVVYALEQGMGRLGQAVGDMVDAIGDGASGAGLLLSDLLTLTGEAARNIGTAISGLSKAYSYMRLVTGADKPAVIAEMAAGQVAADSYGQALQRLSAGLTGVRDRTGDAVQAMRDMVEATNSMISASLAGQRATLDIREAVGGLAQQTRQYGTSLDAATAKGRANQRYILDAIGAINAKAQATRESAAADGASAGAAAVAGARIRQNLVSSLVAAAQKAGFSASAIRGMIGAIQAADGRIIRTYYQSVYLKPATSDFGIGGSMYRGFSKGGMITGGVPGRDSVPILGMPGEAVLNREAVAAVGGRAGVDAINNGTAMPDRSTAVPARAAMPSTARSVTVNVALANHGVIGSRAELQTWLAGAVDELKRRGRI